jgi:hypothetical protein
MSIFGDLWLKTRYGAPIIVVSGLPRSGTSMMMKMLGAGGLDITTDEIREADEDNPKGYFELEKVKELDKTEDKSWLKDHRGKVVKIISFLLKDLPEDNAYKILFMRRNLEEVIASQNKMLVRRGQPIDPAGDAKMIENYKLHLRKVDAIFRDKPNVRWLDVSYNDVVREPRKPAEAVARFVGSGLDVDKMVSAVDAALYRNRAG